MGPVQFLEAPRLLIFRPGDRFTVRASRYHLVSIWLELARKLATDEAGPAYDHDFHS